MIDPRVFWVLQRSAALLHYAPGQREAAGEDEANSLQAIEAFIKGDCTSILVTTKAPSPQQKKPDKSAANSIGEATAEDAAAAETCGVQQPEAAPAVACNGTPIALCAFAQPFPAGLQGRGCVHLMRKGAHPLQLAELEAAVMYTLLPEGPSVQSLKQVLLHVFSPWLAQQAAGAAQSSRAACLGELHSATQKFVWQLEQATKQLSIGIQLPVPQGVDLSDPEAAAKNEESLAVCEQVEEQWVRMITSTLQQEGQRQAQGRGPLAELTFWQERSVVYSSLYEQLSLPIVRMVQGVVERGSMDHSLVSSFKTQLSDLTRLTLEARDNVKFLLTLERHFKNIMAGSLQSVADTLHPMLNALRMIWIISRYYGDDIRMSNLLERISHGLQDRLRTAVDVTALFRAPSAASIRLVKTCKAVADGWNSSYMQMREKIEESGHEVRWEFSKQLLFENTNYASEVCGELLGMLEAVDDFCKFLGPDLKAVTGDATVVDEVARMVQAMIEPVESAPFNVMDRARAVEWKGIRLRFQRDADDVKLATRDLIDTCFRKLRSVEAAAHLLQSFKRIQTQGAIQRQMNQKLTDVLEHFIKEVNTVQKVFEEGKDNPPLTRNMPPVAGAIRWARGLFGKIKRTMARLQSLEADVESMETGQKAMAACKDLAKAMLHYEKQCYETWRATAEQIATSALQQPVLCREVPPEDLYSSGPDAAAAVGERVAINLAPALLRLLREAKYLDQLGFTVPEAVVNTALQERRLRQHVEELRGMLGHYYQALDGLHSAERALLADHLARLEEGLSPGLARINWNSLSIADFALGVNKAVEEFEALVAQITKNTQMIEKVLQQIARGPLVPPDPPAWPSSGGRAASGAGQGGCGGAWAGAAENATHVPDMQEFYENYEQHRIQAVEGLVQKYRSISPLLLKIEELVVGTSTGKSPKLAGYYAYWERRVFAAVNATVLGAIDNVHARLKACTAVLADSDAPAMPPVLAVTLSLIHPEVVLTPSTGEVTKQLVRTLRNLAESSKAFVRWMDGTCLECPEQYVYGEDSEPFIFSFFQDVSQNPAVIKAMLAVNHTVQKATTLLNKYLEGWKKQSSIWKSDRAALLAKFKARKPSHAALEQKLAQYQRMVEDVQEMPPLSDIEFVRVNCSPLLGAMKDEAIAWLRGIANIMRNSELPVYQAWEGHLSRLRSRIELDPASEGSAEKIKAALEAVLASAPDADIACADLEERARTRLLYGAGADMDALRAELDAVCQLRSSWQGLAFYAAEKQQHQYISVEAVVEQSMGSPDPDAAMSRLPSAVGAAQVLAAQHRASAASRASSLSAINSRSSTPTGEPSVAEHRRASGASSRAGSQAGNGPQRSSISTSSMPRGGAQSRLAMQAAEAGSG